MVLIRVIECSFNFTAGLASRLFRVVAVRLTAQAAGPDGEVHGGVCAA